MTLETERPPFRTAAVDGEKMILPASKFCHVDSIPRQRLQYLAQQIHSLGPAALAYLFADLARGRDLMTALEDYGRLAPYAGLIQAYAVTPPPFAIEGGRR